MTIRGINDLATIFNKIHRKYDLAVNNQAYLYDRNDVACMLNEVDFIEESFTFTYDASMGDYLVIGGENDIAVSINIDNLVDGEIVISVEVYTGNPNFNLLNLVLGENSVGNNIQIILCNETGGVECYNFQTFDEMGDCNSCNPLAPSIAYCDPNNDPLDGISNYTGTFTIPSAVDELCGITSDIPGFSLQTPTNNVGSTEYTYNIDKDNSEGFSGTVSICVIVGGIEVCAYVEISADGCDEYDCPQLFTLAGECSSVDENTGMASFGFKTIISLENQSSIDDLLSEYSICSQDDIFLEGGIINNVLISPLQGQDGYWIIGIMADVSCNNLIYGDVDHDLNILLCNAQGDEICISFEIAFECDACKDIDTGKRNINEYQNKSSIYPNPTSNKVTIAITNKNIKNSYSYNLYNHLGMRVESGKFLNEINEIDISKVMDGIYFMSILENGLIIENHKLILIK